MKHTKNAGSLQTKNNKNIYKSVYQEMKKLHAGTSISLRCGSKLWGCSFLGAVIYYIIFAYFRMKTINDAIKLGVIPWKKDIFYRLLLNNKFKWHSFYYDLILQFIKLKNIDLNKASYIIDDSPLEKRGKKLGFIGKIYDHVTHRYVNGYVIVAMHLVVDDFSIPLDFMFSVSKKQREEFCGKKLLEKCSKNNEIEERIWLSYTQDKLHLMYKMVQIAIDKGIYAHQILFDSWYSCKESLNFFQGLKIDVIAGYKTGKTKFLHKGKSKDIPQLIKEHRHRFRKYFDQGFRGAKITVFMKEVGYVTLIFTENIRDKKNKTRCFISTLYGREYSVSGLMSKYTFRWNIETSFKKLKQVYGFNAYHGTSERALIAHTVLCFTRMLLVISMENDYGLGTISAFVKKGIQKIGFLLHRCKDEFTYACDKIVFLVGSKIKSALHIPKKILGKIQLLASHFNSSVYDIVGNICES
jgi:hypothetical protein